MIAWKLASNDPRLASSRYRCLIPVLYLRLSGVISVVYAADEPIDFFDKPDVIVFVKSFSMHDVIQARIAKRLEIPIILDLCDNIFALSMKEARKELVSGFKEMAKLADHIVVPSQYLLTVVLREISFEASRVTLIPDGVETEGDSKASFSLMRSRRFSMIKERHASWALRYALVWTANRLTRGILFLIRHAAGSVLRFASLLEHIGNNVIPKWFHASFRSIMSSFYKRGNPVWAAEAFAWKDIGQDRNQSNSVEMPVCHHSVPAECKEHRYVLWFGNSGSPGVFGLTDLVGIVPDLEAAWKNNPFTLVVVSDNEAMYASYIKDLQIPSLYYEWTIESLPYRIRSSSLVIIPNAMNEFSLAKSANRAILALYHGAPVVATSTPALGSFRDCIIVDDWVKGIDLYLSDRSIRERHVEKARQIIASKFSGEVIAEQWKTLFNAACRQSSDYDYGKSKGEGLEQGTPHVKHAPDTKATTFSHEPLPSLWCPAHVTA
jgi:glycosyltransferase involved in cell wall biosynthesis